MAHRCIRCGAIFWTLGSDLGAAAVADGVSMLRDRLPLGHGAVELSILLPPRSPQLRSTPLEAETYSVAPSPVVAVWRRVRAWSRHERWPLEGYRCGLLQKVGGSQHGSCG